MLKEIAVIYAQCMGGLYCSSCAYMEFYRKDTGTGDDPKDQLGCVKSVKREITLVDLDRFVKSQVSLKLAGFVAMFIINLISWFPEYTHITGYLGVYLVGSMFLLDARYSREKMEVKKRVIVDAEMDARCIQA